MIGKRERAGVGPATGRRRILFVSEDDLYPKTAPGGMELRGKEFFDRLEQSYVVALLTRARFSVGPREVGIGCPPWEFEPPRAIIAWPYKRARWMIDGACFMARGRQRLRALLTQFHADLVYLNKFRALHPGVLCELLALPVPIVARFGDAHSQRLAAVVDGIGFSEAVCKTLLPVPRPKKDTRDRMVLLFNCNFTRDLYTPRFPAVTYRVIHTGVDTSRFHPAAFPVESARFVFLGRATRDKGFIEFCRAMAALPRALIASIDVIGDGPLRDQGLGILRDAGRADLVGWVGRCSHEAVAERLRLASILAFPTHDDAFPAAILEAMACGLAVVACDVGGISEVVRHGRTGLLVPPQNLPAFVETCRLLAENAGLRRRLGLNARSLVIARHQASVWLAETHALMDEMLQGAERNGTGGGSRGKP